MMSQKLRKIVSVFDKEDPLFSMGNRENRQ